MYFNNIVTGFICTSKNIRTIQIENNLLLVLYTDILFSKSCSSDANLFMDKSNSFSKVMVADQVGCGLVEGSLRALRECNQLKFDRTVNEPCCMRFYYLYYKSPFYRQWVVSDRESVFIWSFDEPVHVFYYETYNPSKLPTSRTTLHLWRDYICQRPHLTSNILIGVFYNRKPNLKFVIVMLHPYLNEDIKQSSYIRHNISYCVTVCVREGNHLR